MWGATVQDRVDAQTQVSIHAPVWGATRFNSLSYVDACFNPRTRVGCDHQLSNQQDDSAGFNPRTRVGCDADKFYIAPPDGVSIHAPVWGATPHRCTKSRLSWFQSTHPCGVRLKVQASADYPQVSIHAPVWGATRKKAK